MKNIRYILFASISILMCFACAKDENENVGIACFWPCIEITYTDAEGNYLLPPVEGNKILSDTDKYEVLSITDSEGTPVREGSMVRDCIYNGRWKILIDINESFCPKNEKPVKEYIIKYKTPFITGGQVNTLRLRYEASCGGIFTGCWYNEEEVPFTMDFGHALITIPVHQEEE